MNITDIGPELAIIIPAYNEEECIDAVVRGFRSVTNAEIVVANNNSTDATGVIAREAGATVIPAPQPGYGSACLAGLSYLAQRERGTPKVVAFADGDGANEPIELGKIVEPVMLGRADLVIGSRPKRARPGSLTVPQKFGNILACRLIQLRFGAKYSDLGPFRAISWQALKRINMVDKDYGWTVEMQVKVAKYGLRFEEVNVSNYSRIGGQSKVSGTIKGVFFAGTKIISTILRHH